MKEKEELSANTVAFTLKPIDAVEQSAGLSHVSHFLTYLSIYFVVCVPGFPLTIIVSYCYLPGQLQKSS